MMRLMLDKTVLKSVKTQWSVSDKLVSIKTQTKTLYRHFIKMCNGRLWSFPSDGRSSSLKLKLIHGVILDTTPSN